MAVKKRTPKRPPDGVRKLKPSELESLKGGALPGPDLAPFPPPGVKLPD